MEYLVEWAKTLYGRSGSGLSGVMPVSICEIESFARQMDIAPLHPWEVEALLVLDGALGYKEDGNTEESILPQSFEE